MRLARSLFVVVSTMLVSVSVPVATGHASPTCDTTVAPGGDIQAALDTTPPGGKICISSGTYAITAPLAPKSSQKILAAGKPAPVITCGTVLFCFDGTLGPTGVTLRRLVLEGALNGDVRTGERWTLDGFRRGTPP